MEIKFRNILFKLDFSFFILLSFAVLYGYESTVQIILFSILHELGHLIMLLIFKLSFYGISLKYRNSLSKIKEFFVLLCGPMVNLILFIVFRDEINLILFILNIFPAVPLDGGRIIKLFFPKVSAIITIIFLIALMCLSCYLLIEYKIYSLFLIASYLSIFNYKELRGLYEKKC